MRAVAWLVIGLLVLSGLGLLVRRPELPETPAGASPTAPAAASPASARVEVIAEGLEVPWALAFAPDGTLYVTERNGNLARLRSGDGERAVERIASIPNVSQNAESGLLGLALDPGFSRNQLLYVYATVEDRGAKNRVLRYRLNGTQLTDERILIDNIPSAEFHDGGRMAFGPDGLLYVTTGDARNPELAQDPNSLAGKVLRIRFDGSIPDDNPFPGSPVYSFGHRNPQGLAWDAGGVLYATEHGPSGPGANCCHDEVNRIEPGKNYGWSETPRSPKGGVGPPSGKLGVLGLVDPVIESGPTETWAPGGAAVVGDVLYFAGLRGEALYSLSLTETSPRIRVHLKEKYGRIRDVVRGPDGALYLTTSNRDGRGTPRPGDDRILRVDPEVLTE